MKAKAYIVHRAMAEPSLEWRKPSDCLSAEPLYTSPQPAQHQQQEPVRVPVTDNTYNYAKSLAEAIFKQHFASDEHYSSGRIVWGVNDTVIGILTQIDNMVADMVRKPAQQEPVAFLANGTRFKISYDNRQSGGQIHGIPPELGGRWVAFVAADDDCHLKLTSPPQRTWVGLSDEEKRQLFDREDYQGWLDYINAIEAKLKEKNT